MSANWQEIIIVGCGVSGLTCGIRFLESGYPVTIIARDLPPFTTSNVAAAIWYPYKAYPIERVLKWGQITFEVFCQLTAEPAAGIKMTPLIEIFKEPTPDPWWKEAVHFFRRSTPDELPPGYVDGYTIEVPVIETPIYMDYILTRYQHLGGKIEQRSITNLEELSTANRLIINCTGLGAKEVAQDQTVYPIRGQIMRVRAPEMTRCWIDETDTEPMYIIPRSQDCIVGGTAQQGDWNLTIDPPTADRMLDRAGRAGLEKIELLEHVVGLRPGRAEVRLEREGSVIHNYGHGGAGFTLSWGCAEEVLALSRGGS